MMEGGKAFFSVVRETRSSLYVLPSMDLQGRWPLWRGPFGSLGKLERLSNPPNSPLQIPMK